LNSRSATEMIVANPKMSLAEYRKGGKKANKHRARPTFVNGVRFASKREAARYQVLKAMENAGDIKHLATQVRYRMEVNGELICTYIADFTYDQFLAAESVSISVDGQRYRFFGTNGWGQVVEDCKSPHLRKDPVFRIKSKLMKALYGIEILLT
jgi:Protein of unknown function (DUF1064)